MGFRLKDQRWLVFYLKMLKYFGVDVLDDSPCNFFKRYFRCFLICLPPAILIFVTTVVNREKGENMEAILLDFRMAVVYAQDIFTLFIFASNKEKIRKVLLYIEETGILLHNNDNGDDGKKEIYDKYTNKLNSYTKKYLMAKFGVLFPANSFLLVIINVYKYYSDPGSEFICSLDSCKQWKTNNIYIYLAFSLYESLTLIVVDGFVHSGLIIMMGTILYNMCMMIRLLQADLERAFDEKRKRRNHAEMLSDLRPIVMSHQRLLILTRDINNAFGLHLFMSLCFIGPLLCINLYCSALMSMVHIASWCFGFSNLFLFCWPGQMLIDAGTDLAKTVYACPWYCEDVKTAKIMLIFLMRSQALTEISPLGYFKLDFLMLATILQSSWSLFSLLKQAA